jgi:hypothetical protein
VVSVHAKPAGEDWVCAVAVEDRGARTEHQVVVKRDDVARWASGSQRGDVEELVRRSFDFLLEREPASSILREFELSVIQRYFPDYDDEIRRG